MTGAAGQEPRMQALLGSKAIPPFAALRAFEAVGRLGGIRKAATALSLHHAVVSRHMASLEAWLGVALFETGGTGSRALTPRGRDYHARVSAALADLAAATTDLVDADGGARLRIWANGGFASKWLGPRLSAFAARHPDLEIELRPSDSPPDLPGHEADVDIRYYGDAYSPPPGGKGLRHLELARPPIMAVAGSALSTRMGSIASVEELLDEPLLHEESDAQWRAWFAAQGCPVPERLPGPRLWHAHLAIAAAVEGRGIALASAYLVSRELDEGTLVQVSPASCRSNAVPLGAYLFTARADRWHARPVARLRRWLEAAIATES